MVKKKKYSSSIRNSNLVGPPTYHLATLLSVFFPKPCFCALVQLFMPFSPPKMLLPPSPPENFYLSLKTQHSFCDTSLRASNIVNHFLSLLLSFIYLLFYTDHSMLSLLMNHFLPLDCGILKVQGQTFAHFWTPKPSSRPA